MYGYFRPFESKLSVGEKKLFHTYYCRLCYCLRCLGGQKLRALTMFDVAIYSIIYSMATGAERPPFVGCEKVLNKKAKLFKDDEVGKKFANLTLIAFGEKIRDDKIDGNKKRAFLLNALFGKAIKKAQKSMPKLAEISFNGTEKINALQNANADIYSVLGAYGDTFYYTFKEMGVEDERYLQILKSIAEWTFFVDMICDYEQDYIEKAYNAFYDESCKTLDALFDKKCFELLGINSKIGGTIIENLNKVNDGSTEWKAVYRILSYSLNTVIQNLLSGKDVEFHYFKELKKNWKKSKVEKERPLQE